MVASGYKPSLLPTTFCLLAGISFGLIVICYYHTPTENWDQELSEDLLPSAAWLSSRQKAMESEGITSQRAQAIAHHGGHSKDMPHELASAHNSLQQKLDAKGQHHAVAASVMHAVTAELDNFEENGQEDMPDDSILEHGQDQSPEETERLKKLKKESVKEERKNIQAVKDVVKDAIKKQKGTGVGVSADADQAMHAINDFGRGREAANYAGSGATKAQEAAREGQKKQSPVKKTSPEMKKKKAAQEFVESLKKSKETRASLQRSQKDGKLDASSSHSKNTVSLAGLAQKAAEEKETEKREEAQALHQELTADEQSFLYQMSDMLSISHEKADGGGESLKMKFLTEEEANAADAVEWNSKLAYGAREEDLVTFLEVQQGMDLDVSETRLKVAAEGLPLLTIDLVKENAKDGLVIVTCASWLYYDFVLNWVGHLKKIGVTNFLIGALDKQTSSGLAALGIPGFQMYPGGTGAVGLTTNEFKSELQNTHKLSRQKVALARLFTDFGYDVVLSDADVVWLKDPVSYFSAMKDVNILTASNELTSSLKPGEEGLEYVEAIHKELSMSVLYVRHSPESTIFVKEWDSMLAGSPDRVDQIAFNTLIARHTTPLRKSIRNDRLATGPKRQLTVGVLPVPLFMNGHTYFVQELYKKHSQQPVSLHVNFNEGGLKGKRHRMREAGLWLHAPSYFESPNGFIEVKVDKPASPRKELPDEEMMDFHIAALNQQLSQVRAGIALAVALERTFVLPKLTCFCDRSWIGLERCRAPGAPSTAIPFVCPLDYVFNPGDFDDAGRQHGSKVDIRDHNFFQHPKVPQNVKDSTVMVLPSDADPARAEFAKLGLASQIQVQDKLAIEDLRRTLDGQLAVKVLSFFDAQHLFGGFSDREWAISVAKRIARLSGVWCCSKVGLSAQAYGMDSDTGRLMFQPRQTS